MAQLVRRRPVKRKVPDSNPTCLRNVEAGLQIYVEQMEQEQGGLQIDVEQVEQHQKNTLVTQ